MDLLLLYSFVPKYIEPQAPRSLQWPTPVAARYECSCEGSGGCLVLNYGRVFNSNPVGGMPTDIRLEENEQSWQLITTTLTTPGMPVRLFLLHVAVSPWGKYI